VSDLTKILISAVAASIGTIVLDAYVRPRINGRSLALLLVNDISRQMQVVVGELGSWADDPAKVPLPRPFLLHVYFASVPKLSDLPAKLIGPVSAFYAMLERANEVAAAANGYRNAMMDAPDNEHLEEAEQQLVRYLASYHEIISVADQRMNVLQPLLYDVAFPSWASGWEDPAPRVLDGDALVEKGRALNRATQARADSILRLVRERAAADRESAVSEAERKR
jgi:hypothetical protein